MLTARQAVVRKRSGGGRLHAFVLAWPRRCRPPFGPWGLRPAWPRGLVRGPGCSPPAGGGPAGCLPSYLAATRPAALRASPRRRPARGLATLRLPSGVPFPVALGLLLALGPRRRAARSSARLGDGAPAQCGTASCSGRHSLRGHPPHAKRSTPLISMHSLLIALQRRSTSRDKETHHRDPAPSARAPCSLPCWCQGPLWTATE